MPSARSLDLLKLFMEEKHLRVLVSYAEICYLGPPPSLLERYLVTLSALILQGDLAWAIPAANERQKSQLSAACVNIGDFIERQIFLRLKSSNGIGERLQWSIILNSMRTNLFNIDQLAPFGFDEDEDEEMDPAAEFLELIRIHRTAGASKACLHAISISVKILRKERKFRRAKSSALTAILDAERSLNDVYNANLRKQLWSLGQECVDLLLRNEDGID